jgi:hypothetical protein
VDAVTIELRHPTINFSVKTMEKIIFISPLPPYKILTKALYIYDLTQNNIEIEFWNVSNFTWGKEYAQRHGEPYIEQLFIDNMDEFDTRIKNVDKRNVIINIQVLEEKKFIPIFSTIKNKNFITSSFPCLPLPAARVNALHPRFIAKKIKHWALEIRPKLPHRFIPDIVFCPGQLLRQSHTKSRIVPVNYMDYEHWLLDRHLPPHPQSINACVFLDEALADHPDFTLLYGQENLSASAAAQYYATMRGFFDQVECDLGLPVIIAAHPKARYHGGEFGNRPIIQGDTGGCMRGAQMAIGHASSSCAYAAMQKIPLLLASNSIVQARYASTTYLDAWSHALNVPVLNTESLPGVLSLPKVDAAAYERFLRLHHTWPQYKNTPSGPDLINFIKTLKPFH